MSRSPNEPPPRTTAYSYPSSMVDVQPPLPPPTFLGRPDYGYSSQPHLPSLSHLSRNMPPPSHPQDPRTMPPQREEQPPARTNPPRSGALSIAALLSDPEPEKRERAERVDSLTQPPAPFRTQPPPHPQEPRPPMHAPTYYHPAYPPSRSPTSPYGAVYAPAATHFADRHAPPGPGRPPSQSPYGHPNPHTVYHSRQPSSVPSTTTSGSAGSPRGYSNEPASAISEQPSAAHAFFPQQFEEPPELDYTLVVRQQPKAARACGFGERDRRVIDPPPIIEVKARDPKTNEWHIESDSYTTLHCVLINAVTGQDESTIPAPREGVSSAQRLMGAAVASPWPGKDEHGVMGSFFVFADLSVRSPGQYKLLFRLLKVNPHAMGKRNKNFIRATIESEPFDVFTAKEFPGMRASSALLRSLRSQGLNVGVKKGSEGKLKGGKGSKDSDSDELNDSQDDQDEEDGEPEEDSTRSTAKAKAEDEAPDSSKGKGKARKRAKKT